MLVTCIFFFSNNVYKRLLFEVTLCSIKPQNIRLFLIQGIWRTQNVCLGKARNIGRKGENPVYQFCDSKALK